MNSSVVEFIRIVSNLSIIVPLVLYFLKIKIASRQVHIIGALVITSALCDLTGFILMSGKYSTALIINIYYLLTFILLSWYYYESIFQARYKKVLPVGSMVFLVLSLLITLTMQDISYYQNRVWVLVSVIVLTYALIFGAEIHKNVLSTGEQGPSAICFNSGVFFYFAWSTGIFIVTEYLLMQLDRETMLTVWSAHNLGNISKNIFLAWGFYTVANRN
jgi:hypothetical protein